MTLANFLNSLVWETGFRNSVLSRDSIREYSSPSLGIVVDIRPYDITNFADVSRRQTHPAKNLPSEITYMISDGTIVMTYSPLEEKSIGNFVFIFNKEYTIGEDFP